MDSSTIWKLFCNFYLINCSKLNMGVMFRLFLKYGLPKSGVHHKINIENEILSAEFAESEITTLWAFKKSSKVPGVDDISINCTKHCFGIRVLSVFQLCRECFQ